MEWVKSGKERVRSDLKLSQEQDSDSANLPLVGQLLEALCLAVEHDGAAEGTLAGRDRLLLYHK